MADECATAAEIYQCGLKKDSSLTSDLIAQNKGGSSVRDLMRDIHNV